MLSQGMMERFLLVAMLLLSIALHEIGAQENITVASDAATEEILLQDEPDILATDGEIEAEDTLMPITNEINLNSSANGTQLTTSVVTTTPEGCYTSLDDIFEVISDDDKLFQKKRFVICPGTVMDVGFLVPGVGIEKGQSPLIPRSNTEFLCGEDGSSENNCVIRGGDFGVIVVPVFFRQDLSVNNVLIKGFTFVGQVQYAAFLASQGDITFEDCITKVRNFEWKMSAWHGEIWR